MRRKLALHAVTGKHKFLILPKNPALLSCRGRWHSAALQYSPGLTPGARKELSKQASAESRSNLPWQSHIATHLRPSARKAKRLPTPSISAPNQGGVLTRRHSCRVRQTVSKPRPKTVCPCEAERQKPKPCILRVHVVGKTPRACAVRGCESRL